MSLLFFFFNGASPTVDVWGELPDDHPAFPLIGRIVVEGGNIDHLLDSIIADLLGSDKDAACFTAQFMGPWPRYLTIVALAVRRGLPAEITKQARSLEGKTRAWIDERNRVTHDAWMANSKTQAAGQFRRMPKNTLKYGVEAVDTKQLEAIVAGLKKLKEDVRQLRESISAALAALREKRQPKKPGTPPR